MKFRLTPLNLITAALLGYFLWILFRGSSKPDSIMSTFAIVFALVLFVVDLIFRIVIPVSNTKKLWLIQSAFIIFVAALIAIIRRITN